MSRRGARWQLLVAAVVLCTVFLTTTPVGAGLVGTTGTAAETPDAGTPLAFQDGDHTVRSVTLRATSIEAGSTVTVEAIVANNGDETAPIETALELNGEAVETQTPEIDPEFPVLVTFERTIEEAETYTVSVNGVKADSELVVGNGDGGDGNGDSESGNGGDGSGDGEGEAGESEPADNQFEVVSFGLDRNESVVGETVFVNANISNVGDEPGDFEIALEVDGEVTETAVVPEIFPGPDINARHSFEFVPDQQGNYSISVSGIERDEQLFVSPAEESSGGGLFSFLGFLPLGIVQPIILFLVLPILLIYLALKALALYLGY